MPNHAPVRSRYARVLPPFAATLLLLWSAVAPAQTLTSGPDEPNQYVLPDPLTTAAGTRVTAAAAWPPRRAETLELFRAHVYGRVPSRPTRVGWTVTRTDAAAMGGAATLKMISIQIDTGTARLAFPVVLFVPNARRGRVPVFLLLNNRPASNTDPTRATKSDFWPAEEVIRRGHAIAAFQVNDLAADRDDGFSSGIHPLLDPPGPRASDAWGKLAAWAWGASRVVDYFQTDRDIDAGRIAVVGHSRGGKAALLAGAEDTRIALAVSNDSGCTGAKISRRRTGESVAAITQNFPYWFAPRYRAYAGKEDTLPIDQHQLLGLMAPRAVYVASAEEDSWADPRGEYLGLHHAGVVYALWGHAAVPRAMPPVGRPVYSGPMGYHIRTGGHDLTLFDWQRFCDFADRLWSATAAPGRDAGAPDSGAAGADAGRPDGARDAGATPSAPADGGRSADAPPTVVADARLADAAPSSQPSPARPAPADASDAPAPDDGEDPRAETRPGRGSRGCAAGGLQDGAPLPLLAALAALVALRRRGRARR